MSYNCRRKKCINRKIKKGGAAQQKERQGLYYKLGMQKKWAVGG